MAINMGGIVCYVRDTIPTKQWTELNQPELETMWMTIRPPKMPHNHLQITICTVYHPLGADDWTLLNHIDQSVDYVRRHHPYTGIIIMGDLNKLMIEPVLQQHSTSSRGKPYSTYQAANNCSFSILQSELYSTRISLNEKTLFIEISFWMHI